MQTGTIKRLTDKGFGFIELEGSEDIFFHASAVLDIMFNDLREGDPVEFSITEGPKGLNAIDVRRIEGGEAPADDAEEAAPAEGEAEAEGEATEM